jgi:hypothetical protein
MAEQEIANKFNAFIKDQNLDEITTDAGFNTWIEGLSENVRKPVEEVKLADFASSNDKLKYLKEKFGITSEENPSEKISGTWECTGDCSGREGVTVKMDNNVGSNGGKRRSRKRRSSKKKRKNKKSKKSRKAKKSRKSRK